MLHKRRNKVRTRPNTALKRLQNKQITEVAYCSGKNPEQMPIATLKTKFWLKLRQKQEKEWQQSKNRSLAHSIESNGIAIRTLHTNRVPQTRNGKIPFL